MPEEEGGGWGRRWNLALRVAKSLGRGGPYTNPVDDVVIDDDDNDEASS